MATLTQYLDYYQGLMAKQYVNLPRASANIRNYVAQAVADNFLETLGDCYDVSTSVGPQLDAIGKYIGITRIVNVPLTTPYFGFWDYTVVNPADQNQNGFYDYAFGNSSLPSGPPVNVPADTTLTISTTTYFSSSKIDGDLIVDSDFIQSQWSYAEFFSYLYATTSSTTLSDGQYRFLLGLQIILNSSNGSLPSIQSYLNQFFGSQIRVVDNTDMTLSYFVTASIPLPIEIIEPYLPKPMGVGLIIVET